MEDKAAFILHPVNALVADGMAMHGARASVAMV